MTDKSDIEALQLELWATQYWMKYLFVAQAKGERMRSTDIIDLIEEMKATFPPVGVASLLSLISGTSIAFQYMSGLG